MNNAMMPVNDRLQNAINELRAFRGCESARVQHAANGSRLLGEVFLRTSIDELQENLDQGIELATLLRISMDRDNDEVIDARIEFVRINNSEFLRKDPRSRLKALSSTAKAFLKHGMMEEFAACTEALGEAQKQLNCPVEAMVSHRKAHLVRDRLGLRRSF